ncbi:hypothetical protein ACFFLS_18560 [Flavobacterium procerum]|uniref:TonB C-terminal domain-containing protein n=1 Tax=Flavobacterium procerum TaxID=1455569 RepID=A0ABV6BUE0_9FLAO
MKPQNKKIAILIICILNVLSSYAQNDINRLFFNLPLEASRDTIYSAIKKYGFIESGRKGTVSQDDTIIKTFHGYLDTKEPATVLADSIKILLSTGGIVSSEIDKYYQNLLIVWSYYHFSNPKAAKIFYRDKKIEIEKIRSEKLALYSNSNDNVKAGSTDTKDYTDVSIKFDRERPGYIVITLEYQRNEGERKLKHQFVPKKELVYREIDPKNLFRANTVDQVPITKMCLNKNDKSARCFIESITRYINVDYEDFNLPPGIQRIGLKFIVDKNKEIINIQASHPNKKLCEEIMQNVSKIKIMEAASNKGIAVDYLVETTLRISYGN